MINVVSSDGGDTIIICNANYCFLDLVLKMSENKIDIIYNKS